MINLRKANFQDKQLSCIDCETTFIFSKGEQYFYASKFLQQPKRCSKCRELRRNTLRPPDLEREADND